MKRAVILCAAVLLASPAVLASDDLFRLEGQTESVRPLRAISGGASFLGVDVSEVTHSVAERLKLKQERGALVTNVVADGPASKAGLQRDDVIVKWNGEAVESAAELSRRLRETPGGRTVRLEVIRNGKSVDLEIALGERGGLRARIARPVAVRVARPMSFSTLQHSRIGVMAQGMTPQLADYFGLSKRSGALIVYVYPDTPAEKAGLRTGDVILSVGAEAVEGPGDVARIMSQSNKDTVELKVMRDKQERTITLKLDKTTTSWYNGADYGDDVAVAVGPVFVSIPAVRVRMAPIRIAMPRIQIPSVTVPEIKLRDIEIPMVQIPQVEFAPIVMPRIEIPRIEMAPIKIEMPRIEIPRIEIPRIRMLMGWPLYRISI